MVEMEKSGEKLYGKHEIAGNLFARFGDGQNEA